MKSSRHGLLAALVVTLAVVLWATPARAQWQIDSKDGKSNIKIGFLAQPQFESLETPDTTSHSTNFFLRRFRVLFGGKIADNWTFFLETDSPNLGKSNPDLAANPTGAKDAGFIYLQDAFVTYNHGDAFKVDAGMMLLGLSHNHLQSAATLLPVDYSPYTFLESTGLQERVGRDYGAEVRGYPGGHFEYRLGVYQGLRGPAATNSIRVAGRAVWYPFAADSGFFYTGTLQATKRLIGVGASFDRQGAPTPAEGLTKRAYSAYGIDAFVEQPVKQGDQGLTLQFNYLRFDGGTLVASLPKQNTFMVEAGYHLFKAQFTPFVQYAARKYVGNPLLNNTWYWQVGGAYWMAGHNRNLKISAGQMHVDTQHNRLQVLAQLQIFFY
jgi:hypothetical protein